jgi:hypothetical protein
MTGAGFVGQSGSQPASVSCVASPHGPLGDAADMTRVMQLAVDSPVDVGAVIVRPPAQSVAMLEGSASAPME